MVGECQINGCGWKMNGKASKQHEVNKNDDDDDDRLKSFQVPKPAVCLSVCVFLVGLIFYLCLIKGCVDI